MNEKQTQKTKIREMLKMQRELDKQILSDKNIAEYPYENIKIAIMTEMGEMMNELPTKFKHWKTSAIDNKEKALIEYVDILHFVLSTCNYFKMTVNDFVLSMDEADEYINSAEKTGRKILVSKALASLAWNVSEDHIDKAVGTMKIIAYLFGYSFDEIYDAYINKNKINYERLSKGY